MINYLILGAGAAGIAAAETIRQYDPRGKISCVSAESAGYYSRPGLAYFLSKELVEKSLYPFSKKDFLEKNISLIHNTAIQVNYKEHQVIFSDSTSKNYERLLIATGARAVRPDVPGIDLDGVIYLDSMALTKQIIKKTRRGEHAVVIGGGITALELVEGLLARRSKVHFFLRGDQYWNRVLDPIESELVLDTLNREGVKIHKNTELESIIGSRGKVKGVTTNKGTTLKAGLVAFAIGVKPRIELAKVSKIEIQRGIKVNRYMETNRKDIFAAGDVVEYFDSVSQSWVVDSLWHIARQQGQIAGANMAGQRIPYERRNPINVTRLAGITTTIIGRVGSGKTDVDCAIVRGESETWQQTPEAVICQNTSDINRLRLLVGDQHIIGAVLMGDQSLSQILENLVADKIDIRPIRQNLLAPGANLSSILVDYWQNLEN